VPNTSVIAFIGQAVLQAPCPMQLAGLTSTDLLSIIPSTVFSGQALTQDRQPRQRHESITGWSDAGARRPDFRALSRKRVARRCLLVRKP
jgi:hypothetical protein